MHRALVSAALVLGLLASPSLAASQYGWTLSASSTDPFVNSDLSAEAMRYLYLWYACSTFDGLSSAEFDLAGTMPVYGITPMNGFLNAGAGNTLRLAIGGCPAGPVLAATIVAGDFLPSEMCLAPSSAAGVNATVDCGPFPRLHGNTWIGFTSKGPQPCGSASPPCRRPVSVTDRSFGSIKSLYR